MRFLKTLFLMMALTCSTRTSALLFPTVKALAVVVSLGPVTEMKTFPSDQVGLENLSSKYEFVPEDYNISTDFTGALLFANSGGLIPYQQALDKILKDEDSANDLMEAIPQIDLRPDLKISDLGPQEGILLMYYIKHNDF